ncbi:hypothetical protein OS493_011308 [Desmophyllum pertusum]|uniref:Uncharacterized protein n=1 Tax=Desmophyllum pertusum TaxID=174260 RepID=A0A9W9Z3J2_9CNID|nr:hypothetical protein OS493_011308 [Desmophyllum pertusum]
MSKFKCKCLNVTVHVKEKATREANGRAFVSETCTTAFFAQELYEVELAVGGITKEVGSLVTETRVDDWDVFSCINCNVDTHALHAVKKYDRVLINRLLESDPVVQTKITSSSEYSSIFKVVLTPVKENDQNIVDNSFAGNAILLGQDTISLAMVSVQEQVKKYLEAEENAMNERIRKFIEKQKVALASLQSRVFKDKQAVYWAIKREEEKYLESSLNEAIADSSRDTPVLSKPGMNPHFTNPRHNPTSERSPPCKPGSHNSSGFSKISLHPGAHPSRRTRRPPRKPQQKDFSLESDADPMFSLDDFTDDCEPFFESEEDDLSSSDNSFQSEELIYNPRLKNVKKSTQYSTSVPISMPTGKNSPPMDEHEHALPDPSKIGESMKALARSVHDNSSEKLFGELPRPRRSTFSYR